MKFRIYLLLVVCYFLQFSSIFAQQPPLQQCRKNATFSNETLQSLNNTVNQGSAQIDSDEHVDLYFIHQASQQIEFWFGDGTGSFPTKLNFNSGDVHDLALSDFNLDGLSDLLVLNQTQDRLSVYLGSANRTWQNTAFVQYPASGARSIQLADLNGDSLADLIYQKYNGNTFSCIAIKLGIGNGLFDDLSETCIGSDLGKFFVGDLDQNNQIELYHPSTQMKTVFNANGSVARQDPLPTIAHFSQLDAIWIADTNTDEHQDLVVIGTLIGGTQKAMRVYLNQDGSFSHCDANVLALLSTEKIYDLNDFNFDGKADFVSIETCSTCASKLTLHLQQSKNTYLSPEMLQIPAGSFLMGSNQNPDELPIRRVTLDSFWMSRTEITVAQYRACVLAKGCTLPSTAVGCNYHIVGRDLFPVNCISWTQAKAYATWLSTQDPIFSYQLPSESQWEYVARNQGLQNFPWGNGVLNCDRSIIPFNGSNGCGLNRSTEVCSRSKYSVARQANPMINGDHSLGLCDLIGNVGEWTLDYYQKSYLNAPTNGLPFEGTRTSTTRPVRGGSWLQLIKFASSTTRAPVSYTLQHPYVGIRLVGTQGKCGNGILNLGETCDDGNRFPNDGCDSSCEKECGNGFLDVLSGEECDDGNQTNGDGCDLSCRFETCGNGLVQINETCDDGNFNQNDGCDQSCQLERCGNGVLQIHLGEQCDLGAGNSNLKANTCRLDCKLARCGDGVKDTGEACDTGLNNSDTRPNACRTNCQLKVCGDGVIDTGETCDHGINNSNILPNACRTTCKKAFCGDQVIDALEICDDGLNNSNTRANACRTTCKPAFCGDGVKDTGEACDMGARNSNTLANLCRKNCVLPICGDGVKDTGEACDMGANNSDINPNACRSTCRLPVCGDGVIDSGETCDDGNLTSNDGCDSLCKAEVCGNGILQTYNAKLTSISASLTQSCSIEQFDQSLICWGYPAVFSPNPVVVQPQGKFLKIDMGETNACAIRSNNTIACWGESINQILSPPNGLLAKEISVGFGHACAVDLQNDAYCWGSNNDFDELTVPLEKFTKISAGGDYDTAFTCGIKLDGTLLCWGDNFYGQQVVPAGQFIDISAGANHICAIDVLNQITCWGADQQNRLNAPMGSFVKVSANQHTCALDTNGQVLCWGGDNDYQELNAPVGTWIDVAVGTIHSCAIDQNRQAQCWGDNSVLQTTVISGNREECDDGNQIEGDACGNNCRIEVCGNGIIQGSETCDDGNFTNGDGCDANCKKEVCGNRIQQFGEVCDTGTNSMTCDSDCSMPECGDLLLNLQAGEVCETLENTALCDMDCTLPLCGDGLINLAFGEDCDDMGNSLTCDADCSLSFCGDHFVNPVLGEECDTGEESMSCNVDCTTARCGDFKINQTAGETCDDGAETIGCNANCTNSVCGDGIVNVSAGEECDGNGQNTVNCNQDCKTSRCGDGVINLQAGETCDDANQDLTDACPDGLTGSCQIARCGDGHIQFGVENCDDGNQNNQDACKNDCQVATCGDGIVNLLAETCDDGNVDQSDGCKNDCQSATCGDGILYVGVEECDDGNLLDNDGCNQNCLSDRCGDGVVQTGETCDDANVNDQDACRNNCQLATCGDGVINLLSEQCDDQNLVDVDLCRNNCQLATCGDGVLFLGNEQCDDGNAMDNDECTNTCQLATCGDGILDQSLNSFENCDDGNANNLDGCLDTCLLATCGDGFVQVGIETCEDGNLVHDDACSNTCQTARCGDGITQAVNGESCDDGNQINTDGCLNHCQIAVCGDQVIQQNLETCDDGNLANDDACTNACQIARCGDGIVRTQLEACDDGNMINDDACSNTCQMAVCGDGIVQAGEACDDGNRNDTDLCADLQGGCLYAICGDGFVQTGVESCDDGNQNDLDLCSNQCIKARCGDGVVQSNEDCDDLNGNNLDACTNLCEFAKCGDGFVQAGEICDDRNLLGGDGCSATCTLENQAPLVWREIPAGSYLRGSRETSNQMPVLLVTVPRFLLSRTEVTIAQYAKCVAEGACTAPAVGTGCNWNVIGRDLHPVNCITWFQAKAYATWLDQKMPSNYMVRLPSEAEWEYAARNLGQFFKFSWADVSTATCQNINFVESKIPGCDLNATKKVCSYSTSLSPLRNPPQNMDSPQGICDLNGNIAEWVEDAYLISYQGVPTDGSANQPAPNSNNLQKVYRGGSWRHTLSATTSLVRSAYNRSSQANFLGMRVASTCVSDSPVEICGDLIDNNCNGELNESCQ